ncbi:MAG: hypothetical protein IKT58_06515 [Oscillospiraceae bacterium]|nr:hypothetical protein [Oscillospiraceae bacterium]
MSHEKCIENASPQSVLREFLAYPLDDGGEILARFAALPGARYVCGSHRMERYVYVPGTRKDAILLVAHVDTVWDRNYAQTGKGSPVDFRDGKFVSSDSLAGIGADDRAGCALLWLLRESGHGLLLLDGEEKGHFTGKFIRQEQKDLLRELNRYAYLLALDLPGEAFCHYHNIPITKKFSQYIESAFGCRPMPRKFGSDLPYLLTNRCGANLSIGVYCMHRQEEVLDLEQWMRLYGKLLGVLQQPQSTFRSRTLVRLCRYGEQKLKLLWSRIRTRGKAV